MLKNIIGALAAILLLVWLTQVAKTQSIILGVVFPIVGFILAMIWFIWAAQEKIAERAQPQVLDLEALELLKRAVREKKARQQAAAERSASTGRPASGSGPDSRTAGD